MFCMSCGNKLPEPLPAFCPSCGTKVEAAPAQQPPAQQPPASTQPMPAAAPGEQQPIAERIGSNVSKVAAQAERFTSSSELLGKVPGRSLTLVALGLVAIAIVVGFIGDNAGLGWIWATVMAVAMALVAIQELSRAGYQQQQLPTVSGPLMHPLFPIVFTVVVIGHALRMFDISLVGLLWTAGAVALSYEQYRRAKARFGTNFDLSNAISGANRPLTLVAGVAIVTFFFDFSDSAGFYAGGYDYNYYSGELEYDMFNSYIGGSSFPGRTLRFSELVLAGLVFIVLWASFRVPPIDPQKWSWVPTGLAGLMAAWWVWNGGRLFWAWVFMGLAVGIGVLGFLRQRSTAHATTTS
jgi:hypothetical protein